MKRIALLFLAALLSMNLAGCTRSGSDQAEQTAVPKREIPPLDDKLSMEQKVAVLKVDMMQEAALPPVTVYKSPTCGCCKLWVEHMKHSGFQVSVVETQDLNPIKRKLGVPAGLGSCHTAKVGNYFVEGHVPASDVKRLLKQKPDALGISVPGMPIGSPGMEVPSGETQPYTVTQVNKDGSLSIFSSHQK
ncbi:MAG: DUF411 domain-containing protein [Arenimonas sp.]